MRLDTDGVMIFGRAKILRKIVKLKCRCDALKKGGNASKGHHQSNMCVFIFHFEQTNSHNANLMATHAKTKTLGK